jgi:hypothetical protein
MLLYLWCTFLLHHNGIRSHPVVDDLTFRHRPPAPSTDSAVTQATGGDIYAVAGSRTRFKTDPSGRSVEPMRARVFSGARDIAHHVARVGTVAQASPGYRPYQEGDLF